MDARRFVLTVAFLCSTLALGACSDSHSRSAGAGTPGVMGTSNTSPSLEGSWVVTSRSLTNNCGSLDSTFEPTTVLTVVQAGNSFNFTLADDCGNAMPGGTGQIDPSGTLQLGNQADVPVSATCTVHATQDWTGVTRMGSDVFSGSNVLNLAQMGGATGCNATLPCTVTGSFNARRCPATGCQVTCTP